MNKSKDIQALHETVFAKYISISHIYLSLQTDKVAIKHLSHMCPCVFKTWINIDLNTQLHNSILDIWINMSKCRAMLVVITDIPIFGEAYSAK